jgi:hypothetical protein
VPDKEGRRFFGQQARRPVRGFENPAKKPDFAAPARDAGACLNAFLHRLDIGRDRHGLARAAVEHAVQRGDIAIIAPHRDHDMVGGGQRGIGGVKPPAQIRAAPDRHPGMHHVRAHKPRHARRRIGAQIAADIGGGQADGAQRRS